MRAWIVLLLLLSSSLFASGCAHQTVPPSNNGIEALSEEDYTSLINNNTSKSNQYNGLYQTFQADVSILSSEVQSAQLKQRAAYMQWDAKQLQSEREKMLQENSAYAKFFLRFYSPIRDYDDLHKGKTIWKVYLEVSGQRLEGKVKKMTDKYVEIKTLYPHFDHFATPYEITFNLPMATLESKPSKVTLTSSLGTAEFTFPVKK
jgi:hypothetical protein